MKILLSLFCFLLLFSISGFSAIDEYISPKTLDWDDVVDATNYLVYCEEQGAVFSYNSPNAMVVASEISLLDAAHKASLGLMIDGATYELCVVSVDANSNRSACSNKVTYFLDQTPPAIAVGVIILNR